MKKTREQILAELETIITNSAKIIIEPAGQQVAITLTIEFYPMPKTKSEKYKVVVDEKQLRLPGIE